ncbi:MAG: hypothetical protein IKD72_02950 [Clostridia bacterium]|nr:hypothetical protein [Clostridia bacterium]
MTTKRLLALLAAVAMVLALTACHIKNEGGKVLSEDEIQASQVAEASSAEAASIEAESVAAREMNDIVKKEIGKTEKNKQVVAVREEEDYTTYRVYKIDRKGVCEYLTTYTFYDDSHYEFIKNQGDRGNDKLIRHDDDARLLVYKSTTSKGFTYEDLVKNYAEDNEFWSLVK